MPVVDVWGRDYAHEWQVPWEGDSCATSLFIYGLVCPRDNEVRYVGATARPRIRLSEHRRKGLNQQLEEWRLSLKKDGHRPEMIVLEIAPYEGTGGELEAKWIWYFRDRGNRLLNGWIPRDGYGDE